MNKATAQAGESAAAGLARPAGSKRHRRITRARVLDAAERLFGAQGFHGTSMQEIAAEAGYTTGALYSSFNGKDDLFLAVLERRRALREEIWRDALGAAMDSTDGAVAMGASLRPDPAWYATLLEFMVRAARDPQRRHVVPQMSGYSSREAFFTEALERVSATSPLPADRLGPIIWALVLGFSESWFAEPEAADPTLFSDAIAVLVGTEKPEPPTSPADGRPFARSSDPELKEGR